MRASIEVCGAEFPGRGDDASFADFGDPDGNAGVAQERNHQPAADGLGASRQSGR